MNFLRFINESNMPKVVSLNNDEAMNILKKYCLDTIKTFVKKDIKLFRGMDGFSSTLSIDSSNINRKSANTYNVYTPIINEHLSWSNFPKRNIICSTSITTAKPYGELYWVFPYDNTKLGLCLKDDIWESWDIFKKYKSLFYNSSDFNMDLVILFNDCFGEKIKGFDNLIQLKNICSKYTKEDIIKHNKFINETFIDIIEKNMKEKETIYDFLIKIYNPDKFNVIDYKKINNNDDKEIWFDGKAILISHLNIKIIKEIYKTFK